MLTLKFALSEYLGRPVDGVGLLVGLGADALHPLGAALHVLPRVLQIVRSGFRVRM